MSPAFDVSWITFLAAAAPAAGATSADVLAALARNLIVILAAGAIAGIVCRRLNVSILIGYLAVGTLLGKGGLPVVDDDGHYVSHLAEAGVFLLLFTIGLELSLTELAQLGRWMLFGGSTQLLLVGVPVAGVLIASGTSTSGAILMAAAVAFSSTVLVFKALTETGDVASPHGRRALAILLSQDVALVPLLLVIPLITQQGGAAAGPAEYLRLALNTVGLILGIGLLRWAVARFVVPLLAQLRSTEVVMLFTLALLGGVTYATALLGLPAPLGAFAAGIVLSENRLTAQIDALVLPFREAFSAVFFVSLGLLIDPKLFFTEAYILLPMCVAVILLKTAAAAVAMRVTKLPWRASFGMALGLSQVGEFGFVLALQALQAGLIVESSYTRFLLLAMVSMICTPFLLSVGLKFVKAEPVDDESPEGEPGPHEIERTAIVIGMGPVGKQIACRLEMAGVEPFLIDLSHVNLYQFAQQGFRVLSGDASDPSLLRRALAPTAQLVAVCVPDDDAALRIARSVREMNKTCRLVVRCRYVASVKPLKKAGADVVVSEESEASTALLHSLDGTSPCENGRPAPSPLSMH